MKRSSVCLVMLFFILTSCAVVKPQRLPQLVAEQPVSQNTEEKKVCASVYPAGRWQFIHSIEFSMADGPGSTVVGVTVLGEDKIRSVLMTIEGFTLFEALYQSELEVFRAVPPFDKPEFAAGLMNDVQAIFLRPPENTIQYGTLANGVACCRVRGVGGAVTDVLPFGNGCWQINTYNIDMTRTRTIIARSCSNSGSDRIPGELELTAPGANGYTLKMTLISAEKL